VRLVYSETETRHAPEHEFEGNGFYLRRHPEALGRGTQILQALEADLGLSAEPPREIGDRELETVHTPDFLRFMREISGTSKIVGPDTFALRGKAQAPKSPMAALGYYCTDPATPIGPNTWEPVRAAASVAITAADIAVESASSCYALCRPPGHHAGADYFGGFCYLNNAALAADRLRGLGRVAVFDFDYHHGNGTQDIFYRSADVFFASIHVDPEYAFPHFYGFEDEMGEEAGRGFTRNYPLAKTCSSHEYRRAVDDALGRIAEFDAAHIVVSVGFDAYEGDPVGGLCLSFADFESIGAAIADLQRPVVLVQEGGYSMENVGSCAVSFVSGLLREAT
jgi:acetoin utilization deacetylase AcuC-like enzyme